MSAEPIAIVSTGLVTSVGLSAPAACAAIRAAVTRHGETRVLDAGGEWIVGAQVPLEAGRGPVDRLVAMLKMAIEECAAPLGRLPEAAVPLLLCVAERERPGRIDGLDEGVFVGLERQLGVRFEPRVSGVIPQGRVSVLTALARARELVHARSFPRVLVAAGDSLLTPETLHALDAGGRLLTRGNPNGLVPGEAAGAVLVAADAARSPALACRGLGFAQEAATVHGEDPLRADGLTQAIRQALDEAGCELHDLDFRITDNSGEQYYFKEAALALSRTMRKRKEEFDIWHPADCIGETGAAIGVAALAVALAAGEKEYAPGPAALFHAGSDGGRRAAAVLRYEVPT